MTRPECLLLTDDYLPHFGGSRIYYHKVAGLLEGRMAVVTRRRAGTKEFDEGVTYPLKRITLYGGSVPGPRTLGEAADFVSLARTATQTFPTAKCIIAGEITPSAFAALAAARLRGIKYGVFVHDEPLMGAGKFEAGLRRKAMEGATALVVASTFAARRAAECAHGAAIVHAFAGVDIDEFSRGAVDTSVMERHVVRRREYLLSVGRLVDYKNVSLVLKALAMLKSRDTALVIVGEGPERANLEAEAREIGIGERVRFAGRVGGAELVNLYRGAIAYVFPSRRAGRMQHEGIGMAGLEAAACGTVVLASTDTSAGDYIEHGRTGYMFDPGDAGALAGLVDGLIERPSERVETATRGMEVVRREFSWRRTAAGVGEAIDLLVGK